MKTNINHNELTTFLYGDIKVSLCVDMALQQITGFELKQLTDELQILVDSKVDKIYMLSRKDLVFNMHKTAVGKMSIRIVLPNLLYLTKKKFSAPEVPHGYCMFLRKYIGNARLRSISMVGSERILDLHFETKDGKYHLFLEFFDKGNAILTDDDLMIKSPLENQNWAERTIRGGVKYEFPKKDYDFFSIDLVKFKDIMNCSGEDNILKRLTSLGLGKEYSNEILKRARVDPLKMKLSPDENESLFSSVRKFMREKPEPSYYHKTDKVYVSKISSVKKYSSLEDIYGKASDDVVPEFDLSKIPDDTAVEFPSINEAFDFMIEMPKPEEKEEHLEKSKSKDKLTKVIDAQSKRLKEQEQIAEENQAKGEAIYENYALVKDIMDQISTARKKMSWNEIKEKLKGHKIIKSVDEKTGTITIELGE